MPSNISKTRLHKAFNEGRRSATLEGVENPYDNPKLRKLWDLGRTQQRAGELKTPIPALEHGETRAQRPLRNPPRTKRVAMPPSPRNGPGFGGSGRSGYGRPGFGNSRPGGGPNSRGPGGQGGQGGQSGQGRPRGW